MSDVAFSVAKDLGETEPYALEQIEEIIRRVGIEKTRLIVVAAKIMHEVGGMVRMSDYVRARYHGFSPRKKKDKGPRTLGGTFFFLFSLHPEGAKMSEESKAKGGWIPRDKSNRNAAQ